MIRNRGCCPRPPSRPTRPPPHPGPRVGATGLLALQDWAALHRSLSLILRDLHSYLERPRTMPRAVSVLQVYFRQGLKGGGIRARIRSRDGSFILPWGLGKQQHCEYRVPVLKSLSSGRKREQRHTHTAHTQLQQRFGTPRAELLSMTGWTQGSRSRIRVCRGQPRSYARTYSCKNSRWVMV